MASNHAVLMKFLIICNICIYGANTVSISMIGDWTHVNNTGNCKCDTVNETTINFQYNWVSNISKDGEEKCKGNIMSGWIYNGNQVLCNKTSSLNSTESANHNEWVHVYINAHKNVCYHYEDFEYCVNWQTFSKRIEKLRAALKPLCIFIIGSVGFLTMYSISRFRRPHGYIVIKLKQ